MTEGLVKPDKQKLSDVEAQSRQTAPGVTRAVNRKAFIFVGASMGIMSFAAFSMGIPALLLGKDRVGFIFISFGTISVIVALGVLICYLQRVK